MKKVNVLYIFCFCMFYVRCYHSNIEYRSIAHSFIGDEPSVYAENRKKIKPDNYYHAAYPNSTFDKMQYELGIGECENDKNCFLPYGVCIDSKTCLCMPEYANYNKRMNDTSILTPSIKQFPMFCFYKRKKVIIAGMLELFLPLGLGHFYSGRNFYGLMKCIYNFIVYWFGCSLFYKGVSEQSSMNSTAMCLLLTCLIPVWNILDVFMFFTYTFKDGLGIDMV